uniref:Ig-like domain-containing protein n=1 Tax=Electrophorus electricus TaxID=8005 RepID=A0AAY5EG01_ELEEL
NHSSEYFLSFSLSVVLSHIYITVMCLAVPVSKPYILVSDSSPVEAASMWMRCGLENGTGPIQYTWEQGSSSQQVTTLAESNSSLLNITWVTRNHTGWYRCLARNEVNQQRSDQIWLNVIFGPDLPQIDVTPYSVTDRGYSALEKETVSLMCQASSNPPSQYVWFYNNSQVYTGPQYTITKILRMHTGNYACLAQNTYLNTRSRKAITLTVYCECCQKTMPSPLRIEVHVLYPFNLSLKTTVISVISTLLLAFCHSFICFLLHLLLYTP